MKGDPSDRRSENYDPRKDSMAPPQEPCECFCLHCRRTFVSDQMWFQRVVGAKDGFPGFWMCPTPNCDGKGFTFDIFPTDPDHPANEGWQSFDDDDGAEEEEWDDEEVEELIGADEGADAPEWDPSESRYEAFEQCDEDLEGEEWKLGLEPGERPKVEPPPPGVEPRNWAEQEALFDAPDRRPRELDWSNREDRSFNDFNEDDIPY